MVAVPDLRLRRVDRADPALDDHRGELLTECSEFVVADRPMEAEDELVADKAHRVVRTVEVADLVDRLLDGVGNSHETHVVGRDESRIAEFRRDEVVPMVPVGPAGFVEQDDGGRGGLAGLDEGE